MIPINPKNLNDVSNAKKLVKELKTANPDNEAEINQAVMDALGPEILNPETLKQVGGLIPSKEEMEKNRINQENKEKELLTVLNRIADENHNIAMEIHGFNSLLHKYDNIITVKLNKLNLMSIFKGIGKK